MIVHLAAQVDPNIEVIFLDTGSHFPETLEYVERVRSMYDLNLRVVRPVPRGRRLAVRVREVLRVPQGQSRSPAP